MQYCTHGAEHEARHRVCIFEGCNHCTHSPSTPPHLPPHEIVIILKAGTGHILQGYTNREEDVCTDSPGNKEEQADETQMGGTITQRNTAYKTGESNAGENKNHQYRKMTVK